MRYFYFGIFVTFLSFVSFQSLAAGDTDSRKVVEVSDVETLNDDLKKYNGKKVRIRGEIEDKIDSRSAKLESGGIFNNEIVIVSARDDDKKSQLSGFSEGTEVMVTGTVVMKPLSDIRRDYNWTLDSALERSFRNVKAYLVVDEVKSIRE